MASSGNTIEYDVIYNHFNAACVHGKLNSKADFQHHQLGCRRGCRPPSLNLLNGKMATLSLKRLSNPPELEEV